MILTIVRHLGGDLLHNRGLALIIEYTKESLVEFDGQSDRCTEPDKEQLARFEALKGKQGDSILREFLPYYTEFLSHAGRCPELVRASILLLLNNELGSVLLHGEDVSLTQAAGTALFDLYSTYTLYKYWTTRASQGNSGEWKFVLWEDEVRSRFQRLWKVSYGRDSYCQCVEGYDFFSSMDTTAKTLLRRLDYVDQALEEGSEVHRILKRNLMCQADGGGMPGFNSLAISSDCISAMTTLTVLCATNFALQGRLNVTLNLAESALHGLTLASHCIDEEVWAFERAEAVGQFFADVAQAWWERNPSKAIFQSRPHGQLWDTHTPASICEWVFQSEVTFGDGELQVSRESEFSPSQVSVCTESFTTSVHVKHVDSEVMRTLCDKSAANIKGDAAVYAVVIHNGEFRLNLWHDMHWILKVFRQKRLIQRVFKDPNPKIDLVIAASVSSTNAFGELMPWHSAETRKFSIDEVKPWLELHQPWLRRFLNVGEILTLNDAQGRCYKRMIWGAPAVRFDRELRKTVRRSEIKNGWESLRNYSRISEAGLLHANNSSHVVILQRPVYKGRILVNEAELSARLNAPVYIPTGHMSLFEQISLVRDARVIIGPHGAALALMAFMKRPGLVLELIAKEVPDELLHCPDMADSSPHGMYGGLARLVGVHHACIRSWSTASSKPVDIMDLTVWRKIDISVDVERIAKLVETFLLQYPS